MRTIYIDSDFKCHITDDGTMTPLETDYFDGKCDTFIEGYRFIPSGESWTRKDGAVFRGKMGSPWKPYDELAAAQEQYEKDLLERADLEAAYNYLLTGGIA
jgi:hypothetical protein